MRLKKEKILEKIGIRKIEDLQPTALPKWFLAILAAAALSISITIPLLLFPFAFNQFFGFEVTG